MVLCSTLAVRVSHKCPKQIAGSMKYAIIIIKEIIFIEGNFTIVFKQNE